MSLLETSSAWPSILENIRSRVTKQQYATWFQNLQAQSQTPEDVSIRVPHQFFKEWLTQNYLDVISASVFEVTGARPTISFTIDETMRSVVPSTEEDAALAPLAPSAALPRLPLGDASASRGLQLNPHYTFETFVVGPSNQLANAAAVAVTASPGRTYNPLFTYGSVGLGKSHLLQAICHGCLSQNPTLRVAYLSCETFVNGFISALQKNDLPSFRARYRQVGLLLIDDIQFLSRAERSQEEFFHTFNDLYNAQKQIVLSSDQPPQEITGLQERLLSRFKSGLVARIDPPSYEMRVAVLKRKAELRNVVIPDDVLEYTATAITSNIRELDGAITKVVGCASLLNQPITLAVAKTALNEPVKPRAAITVGDIVRVVTDHFKARLSDLQSKKRTRSIVLPRQICMYLARSLTVLSLEEIGGYFGGRDHSTVLHAEEKIRSDIKKDPSLSETITLLLKALGLSPNDLSSRGRG